MESPKTKILLEKYWAGNSSVEEEAELKRLFKNGIPQEDKKYEVLFSYSETISQQENKFDLDFLDEVIKKKKSSPTVFRLKKWNMWATSVAASILIVVLSVSYQWKDLTPVTAENNQTNTAYEQTLYALTYLSEKLNKGNASIYELSSFDKAKKQVINEND